MLKLQLNLKCFFSLFIINIIIFISTGYGQCKLDYSNYSLVFEENFDNISSINQLTNRWMFQHDDPNFGWGDYRDANGVYQNWGEYYDPGQVSSQPGGILRLTAQRVPATPIYSSYRQDWRYPVYKSGIYNSGETSPAHPSMVATAGEDLAMACLRLE